MIALAFILLITAGCGTAGIQRLRPDGPEWRIQQGQAVWRRSHRAPELAGELVLARRTDGACVFDFSKTPLPITFGQTTSTNWLIGFPAIHMSFGGRKSPPGRFTWLYLNQALMGEPIPPRFQFSRFGDAWKLLNLRSGESIEGVLAP